MASDLSVVNTAAEVLAFMEKHRQYVQSEACLPPPNVGLLRLRLIGEELGELCAAVHARDWIEVADALADLEYVVAGTAIAFGLEHRFYAKDGLLPPQVIEPGLHVLQASLRSLYISFGRFCSAMEMSDLLQCQTTLEDMSISTQLFANVCCIPLNRVFREVHRSNMTKAPLDSNNKGGKVGKEGFQAPQIGAILESVGFTFGER